MNSPPAANSERKDAFILPKRCKVLITGKSIFDFFRKTIDRQANFWHYVFQGGGKGYPHKRNLGVINIMSSINQIESFFNAEKESPSYEEVLGDSFENKAVIAGIKEIYLGDADYDLSELGNKFDVDCINDTLCQSVCDYFGGNYACDASEMWEYAEDDLDSDEYEYLYNLDSDEWESYIESYECKVANQFFWVWDMPAIKNGVGDVAINKEHYKEAWLASADYLRELEMGVDKFGDDNKIDVSCKVELTSSYYLTVYFEDSKIEIRIADHCELTTWSNDRFKQVAFNIPVERFSDELKPVDFDYSERANRGGFYQGWCAENPDVNDIITALNIDSEEI